MPQKPIQMMKAPFREIERGSGVGLVVNSFSECTGTSCSPIYATWSEGSGNLEV